MITNGITSGETMSTTVTSKGQVTIPKKMRDSLGLRQGSQVDFTYTADGELLIRPVLAARKGKPASRFAALRGTVKLGMSTDEYMNLIRGYDEDKDDPGFRNGE
jgi:antitoxin PrlF